MGWAIKIKTKHQGTESEKATLLASTDEYSVSEQRDIVIRMTSILRAKGKKDNWMTGLGATTTLREQYAKFIEDRTISEDEFKYFQTLVPKAEFGTESIVELVHAEVSGWKNQL